MAGESAKAKSAYNDFLTLWKDGDPDILILKEAKTTIVNKNAGTTTTGNLGTVTVTAGALVSSCGRGCFTFTGGTIDIVSIAGSTLFMGSFNGTLISAGGVVSLSCAEGGIPVIGGFQVSAAGVVSGDTIVTPEPGTLSLLGTGLLGLAGMVRRKIR
jgi:PEP-CTERM motif